VNRTYQRSNRDIWTNCKRNRIWRHTRKWRKWTTL